MYHTPAIHREGHDARLYLSDPLVSEDTKSRKFITTRRYPIYYLGITKCGLTFLKNLFYLLDHDKLHEHADDIHEYPHDLLRAATAPEWVIRRSRYAFTVLRDPVSRFVSLYFDKIYGSHDRNFATLRHEIAEAAGLNLAQKISVEAHQANARALINWIERNLRRETNFSVNPHWRPQMKRVATVAEFKVRYLTLDGLDQQLPALLQTVIPDLPAKMAQVGTRNASPYPVSKTDLIDGDLRLRIDQVYAEDRAKYDSVSRWWKNHGIKPVAGSPANVPTTSVISSHSQNLNVIAMPKAGVTYMRNLVYKLDHGRVHPDGVNIARDPCLWNRHVTIADLKDALNVIVIRDPIDRFLSLYFDKIIGETDNAFPWITAQLVEKRNFQPNPGDLIEEHQKNCLKLTGYLRNRFKDTPRADLNPHWRPQSVRTTQAKRFGFIPLMIENIADQFRTVAKDKIEGLDDLLGADITRNQSEKPIAKEDVLTPEITERLQDLYAEDIALYQRIKAGWTNKSAPPSL